MSLVRALVLGSKVLFDNGGYPVEEGLVEKRDRRLFLAQNLLTTLRKRELIWAAQVITSEVGQMCQQATDGERVSGICCCSQMLSSGRFAIITGGMGVSLVPWKPILEHRLGQYVAATIRKEKVFWEFGRCNGVAIV